MIKQKIGFIGAGQIAGALAGGFTRAGLVDGKNIWASDPFQAAQTVRGAAEMVLKTGEHTGTLKDRVASPGGTTIEGIDAMEDGAVRGALMKAVRRATLKSIELGKSV